MSIVQDIQNSFKNATIAEQFIYLIIAVFFVVALSQNVLVPWLGLSSNTSTLAQKPWTLISYAFAHNELFHVLANSLMLYYIGNLFLNFFSKKQFLYYFFFGSLVGAIFFLLASANNNILLGASAGVTAIVVGLATKMPRYSLELRFIGSVELWVLGAIFVGLSILQIKGTNGGGHFAHLGGALLGFLLTKAYEYKVFSGGFQGNFRRKEEKSPLRMVYKKPANSPYSTDELRQRKINKILDKINKSSYSSLTKEERDFLSNSGKY